MPTGPFLMWPPITICCSRTLGSKGLSCRGTTIARPCMWQRRTPLHWWSTCGGTSSSMSSCPPDGTSCRPWSCPSASGRRPRTRLRRWWGTPRQMSTAVSHLAVWWWPWCCRLWLIARQPSVTDGYGILHFAELEGGGDTLCRCACQCRGISSIQCSDE